MTPPPDFSGPLTAAALAFQLAAGDSAPCDIGSGPKIASSSSPVTHPVAEVRVVEFRASRSPGLPIKLDYHRAGHSPHVPGTRFVTQVATPYATTSSDSTSEGVPRVSGWRELHSSDATDRDCPYVSNAIIEEHKFVANTEVWVPPTVRPRRA